MRKPVPKPSPATSVTTRRSKKTPIDSSSGNPKWHLNCPGPPRTRTRTIPSGIFSSTHRRRICTNTVIELIRNAPAGNIFPTKAELHTPEITSSHVKGMAQYFGAELIGIAKLEFARRPLATTETNYPFAVLCAVHADYDPRAAQGIGGQMPVQNGLFITFVLSSWIRELGFRAKVVPRCRRASACRQGGIGNLEQRRQAGDSRIRRQRLRCRRGVHRPAFGRGRLEIIENG